MPDDPLDLGFPGNWSIDKSEIVSTAKALRQETVALQSHRDFSKAPVVITLPCPLSTFIETPAQRTDLTIPPLAPSTSILTSLPDTSPKPSPFTDVYPTDIVVYDLDTITLPEPSTTELSTSEASPETVDRPETLPPNTLDAGSSPFQDNAIKSLLAFSEDDNSFQRQLLSEDDNSS
jgi:hypothetical protein